MSESKIWRACASRLTTLAITIFALASTVSAYDVETHARITTTAVVGSDLYDEQNKRVLRSLGLIKSRRISAVDARLLRLNLGPNYFDYSNGGVRRTIKPYDTADPVTKGEEPGGFGRRWEVNDFATDEPDDLTPGDWMARGVVREDDAGLLLTSIFFKMGEVNAFDMHGEVPALDRFCNHFYDPEHDRKFTLGWNWMALLACSSSEVFAAAPQWALGTTELDGSGSVQPQNQRKNGFTVLDARESMWRALTGKIGDDPTVISRVDRDMYWATTFRSIGDVVHLLQDLSSPQHTRNEPHPLPDGNLFEKHVNDRARGITTRVYKPSTQTYDDVVPPPLNFGNFRVPTFANYRSFYSTGKGPQQNRIGVGIANITNRSFFTTLANFGNTEYPLPESDRSLYTAAEEPIELMPGVTGVYLKRDVVDPFGVNTATQVALTRESILKEPLDSHLNVEVAKQFSYTIDERVVQSVSDVTVPRAVAYTKGLLNFFFRGRLGVRPTTDGIFGVIDHATNLGFKKIVVKVMNNTADITDMATGQVVPQPMMNGKLVAVVRYHRDLTFSNDLATAIGIGDCRTHDQIYGPGNGPYKKGHDPQKIPLTCREREETFVRSATKDASLAPGEEQEFVFDFSSTPIGLNGSDYSLQIVYRGALGQEDDAVVSGYVDLQDPLFVTRHNMYDYLALNQLSSGTMGLYGGSFAQYMAQRNIPPPYNSIFFVPSSRQLAGSSKYLAEYGRNCWSIGAVEGFLCFDPNLPMNFNFAFGSRQQTPFATAIGVPPGRFVRMAVLAPQELDTQQVLTPPLYVWRQTSPYNVFNGEVVSLPPRHSMQQTVQWAPPMRGVNSWHSDGYVWTVQQAAESVIDPWHYSRHCFLMPRMAKTAEEPPDFGTETPISMTVTPTGTVEFAGRPSQTINCPSRWGVLYDSFLPTNEKFAWSGYYLEDGSSKLRSGYSNWDTYLGTSEFRMEEVPVGFTPDMPSVRLYARDKTLDLDGKQNSAGGVLIKSQAPVPVTIADKYR